MFRFSFSGRPRFAVLIVVLVLFALGPRRVKAVNESEPNDSIGTANPFTIGDQLFGDLADPPAPFYDFYSFSANAGYRYLFVGNPISCTTFVPSLSMNIALQVRNGANTILATAAVQPDCLVENLIWTAPSAGTYYLVVYEQDSNQTINGVTYRIDTYIQATPTPTPAGSPTPTPNAARNWELYE